jgi:hypothetical protein
VARAGPREKTGGGSSGDWDWVNSFGRSVYVVDLKNIWRLDHGVPEGQWKNNPNKWKFDSPSGCLLRV